MGSPLTLLQMMYLALTYDHRLLDGREAVTFLVKVKVSLPPFSPFRRDADNFAGIHRRPEENVTCISVIFLTPELAFKVMRYVKVGKT